MLIPLNCVQRFVPVYGVSLDGAVLGLALRFLRTPSLQSTDHNEAFWERREEEEGHERSRAKKQ